MARIAVAEHSIRDASIAASASTHADGGGVAADPVMLDLGTAPTADRCTDAGPAAAQVCFASRPDP